MTAHITLNESNYLFLQASDDHEAAFSWSVSAWTVIPDKDVDHCWFTTDVFGDANKSPSMEQSMRCAEQFVENFQESLNQEIEARKKFLSEELSAIEQLRKLLESIADAP